MLPRSSWMVSVSLIVALLLVAQTQGKSNLWNEEDLEEILKNMEENGYEVEEEQQSEERRTTSADYSYMSSWTSSGSGEWATSSQQSTFLSTLDTFDWASTFDDPNNVINSEDLASYTTGPPVLVATYISTYINSHLTTWVSSGIIRINGKVSSWTSTFSSSWTSAWSSSFTSVSSYESSWTSAWSSSSTREVPTTSRWSSAWSSTFISIITGSPSISSWTSRWTSIFTNENTLTSIIPAWTSHFSSVTWTTSGGSNWVITHVNVWVDVFSRKTCHCTGEKPAANKFAWEWFKNYLKNALIWKKQAKKFYSQHKIVGKWWKAKAYDIIYFHSIKFAHFMEKMYTLYVTLGQERFTQLHTKRVQNKFNSLSSRMHKQLQGHYRLAVYIVRLMRHQQRNQAELLKIGNYKGQFIRYFRLVTANMWRRYQHGFAGALYLKMKSWPQQWYLENKTGLKWWGTQYRALLRQIFTGYIELVAPAYNLILKHGVSEFMDVRYKWIQAATKYETEVTALVKRLVSKSTSLRLTLNKNVSKFEKKFTKLREKIRLIIVKFVNEIVTLVQSHQKKVHVVIEVKPKPKRECGFWDALWNGCQ